MKTIDEIYSEMAAVFAGQTGLEAGTAGDLAVRLYAVAAQVYSLYHQAEWTKRQCFPQTADGEYLDLHAALRGVKRKSAAPAKGTIRFSVPAAAESDRAIPAGTVCMTAGLVRFETTEAAVLKTGALYIDVPAQAVEPGTAGNAAAGTILTMAVAPAGVAACSNPSAFSGGTDPEDDRSLRKRVLETFRRLANGANAAYYEQTAMAFDQVAAVTALPRNRGVGTVDVVIATRSGMPSAALVEQVEEKLQKAREIAVDVAVSAPATKTVNVTVKVKAAENRDGAQVRNAVEQAVRGWFTGERLSKPVLRAELGSVIYAVDGVENYEITTPAADVPAQAGTLPVLGTVAVGPLP